MIGPSNFVFRFRGPRLLIGPRSLGPTGPTGTAGSPPAVLYRSGLATQDYYGNDRAGLVLQRYWSCCYGAAAAGPVIGPGLRYSHDYVAPKWRASVVGTRPQNSAGLEGHTIGLRAFAAAPTWAFGPCGLGPAGPYMLLRPRSG